MIRRHAGLIVDDPRRGHREVIRMRLTVDEHHAIFPVPAVGVTVFDILREVEVLCAGERDVTLEFLSGIDAREPCTTVRVDRAQDKRKRASRRA
jgi:hypothetical protein